LTYPPSLVVDPTRVLVPEDLDAVDQPLEVTLSNSTRAAVNRCAEFVGSLPTTDRPVYGISTGFGPLVRHQADPDPERHGMGLLNHLRTGQGNLLAPPVARAMLLARLWSLAKGHSGAHLEVLEGVAACLATGFAPAVPEWGSVGASGDLAPLAHAAGALCGEGHAYLDGQVLAASDALKRAGLRPLRMRGRDALALVNGTSLSAAAAGLAVCSARAAVEVALELTALLVELLGAGSEFTSPRLLALSGHSSSEAVAGRLAALLAGSMSTAGRPLQEAYTVRCVPQLVGAVDETVSHADRVVTAEMNGVSDNPVFFPETGDVVHGGNFFGQQIAFVSDALNLAVTQLANLAERQIDLLMDPHRNGGRTLLLSARPGAQSGLAGVNLTATSLVASMRRYAAASSIQSLPTNGHNQDVVPFGTQAALEALRQSERLRLIQASLGVALRQAAALGGSQPRSQPGNALLQFLSANVEPVNPDRPLAGDVERLATRLPRWRRAAPAAEGERPRSRRN
jgi:histidine ammonia-lyase